MSYVDRESDLIFEAYDKFGFPISTLPELLELSLLSSRANHIEEELIELRDSIATGDLAGIADALVDIVYIAKGSAIMMGLPWEDLFLEVHRANYSKEPGINPKRPDNTVDLIKPSGWVGPDLQRVIDNSIKGISNDVDD